MKNPETQLVDYLARTSGHIFMVPKKTHEYDMASNQRHYVYDYDKMSYLYVFFKNEKWWVVKSTIKYKIEEIDVVKNVKSHNGNVKNVIKNWLFCDNKAVSVRRRNHMHILSEIIETNFPK